jgi:hypothetical protein
LLLLVEASQSPHISAHKLSITLAQNGVQPDQVTPGSHSFKGLNCLLVCNASPSVEVSFPWQAANNQGSENIHKYHDQAMAPESVLRMCDRSPTVQANQAGPCTIM